MYVRWYSTFVCKHIVIIITYYTYKPPTLPGNSANINLHVKYKAHL